MAEAGATGNLRAIIPPAGITISLASLLTHVYPFKILKDSLTKISPSVPSTVAVIPVAAVPPTPKAAGPSGSFSIGVKEVTVAAADLALPATAHWVKRDKRLRIVRRHGHGAKNQLHWW